MVEDYFRLAGLVISFAFGVYSLKRKKLSASIVFFIFGPLTYFSVYIGVVLSPAKLLGILFLTYIAFHFSLLKHLQNKYLNAYITYYSYTIFVTILMSLLWPGQTNNVQGIMYSPMMRGWVQIAQVIIGLSIVLHIMNDLSSVNSLRYTQSILLYSMGLISIYGLYVWFAQKTGLPFNPITRQGGMEGADIGRAITTTIGGIREVRAYSLTGEPKSLAVNACFGLVLTLFSAANTKRLIGGVSTEAILVAVFLLALFLTYSTAGYLILPIVLLTTMICLLLTGQIKRRLSLVVSVIFLILIFMLLIGYEDFIFKFKEVLDIRLKSRLESDGLFTYAEAAILKFWADEPVSMMTGVGLGGSAFYVRLYDAYSYAGYIAAPRGIIGFISDKGIIGFILFVSAFFKTFRVLIKAARLRVPERNIYSGILVICSVNFIFIMTYSLWYVEWLTVGIACSGATIAERALSKRRYELLQTHNFNKAIQNN